MQKSIIAGCMAALLTTAPVSAADFTFNIPVRIQNMRNAEAAWVSCDVFRAEGTRRTAIAFGRTDIELRDGAYEGTVTVAFNVQPGFASSDATDWGCLLIYNWRMPDGTIATRGATEAERALLYTRYTGQEIASRHTEEAAPISR